MSGVDDAYRRYIYTGDGLARLYRSARANPLSEENLRLGLVEAGDSRKEAEAKIEVRIAATRKHVNALAFLDLCAAFENECRKRIPTAIGEVRRVVTEHYDSRALGAVKLELVKNGNDFRSLDAIFELMEGRSRGDGADTLKRLRATRNSIAHGNMDSEKDRMTLEDARETLNSVLAYLFPGLI